MLNVASQAAVVPSTLLSKMSLVTSGPSARTRDAKCSWSNRPRGRMALLAGSRPMVASVSISSASRPGPTSATMVSTLWVIG